MGADQVNNAGGCHAHGDEERRELAEADGGAGAQNTQELQHVRDTHEEQGPQKSKSLNFTNGKPDIFYA